MKRDILVPEAWRFTSENALAREIEALLQNSNYKLEVQIRACKLEKLASELEGRKTMGRVKIVQEPT